MLKKREFTDEFKLEVVRNYLNSPYGIRVTARSYNLHSKNYITRWMPELIKKGLLSKEECSVKSKSSANADKKSNPYEAHSISPREKQLELENERLRAEVAFLKKLKEIERRDALKRKNTKP